MIIGILGNVTVLVHTMINKEKTVTSYLKENLALAPGSRFEDLLVYSVWTIEFIQTKLKLT